MTATPLADTTASADRPTEPLLEVDDLRVAFQVGDKLVHAVQGVSLDLAPGEILSIVGESGSGKSTVVNAIQGLLSPNAKIQGGSVRFDGRDMLRLNESQWREVRGKDIGFIPQDPAGSLNPVRKVGIQVAEPLLIHHLADRKTATNKAVELLTMSGLTHPEERANQYPFQFSGGMKQRSLIAGALSTSPKLIIADEPTSALDVTVQKQILDYIEQLVQELGVAVLMITHDLGLAAERSDKVVVMRKGEVVDAGPARAVMSSPSASYTRTLIDAVPKMDAFDTRATRIREVEEVEEVAPLVETRDLVKIFDLPRGGSAKTLTAVDHANLTIRRGETLAVVGESGSGKSTLARIILRLDEPTSGQILFDGKDITKVDGRALRKLRQRMQMVYQSPFDSLNPRMNLQQIISEPLKSFKVGDAAEQKKRARELLDQVSLPSNLIDRFPDELSGGQRQRVAIARALALEPEFVVLDEAVSALDVSVQAQILKLLDELQGELGLSYLFITHDLGVVAESADTVAVIQHGKMLEYGPTAEIFRHPQSDYTRKLLDAVPSL
ncbi:dipeptide ABC transporter ATP-binding protein [Gulosibacter sp. ACHW.36C]|uniref:ABC transporter ATP-binding protein n=1 Tax=Gulosibacter sediminis TaxID=1729695 RepID=A0ABY4N0X6_9MICO|nr:ABC transporter ATP-binding protein [Gulosibacter sediminis]UQN15158.1 ABC transporter ATP-binding protein [Gulosibacter sediminis]